MINLSWYKLAAMSIDNAMDIMELSEGFTLDQLNKKRRMLMRKWHPDVNDDPKAADIAQNINAAHALLERQLGAGHAFSAQPNVGVDVPPGADYADTLKEKANDFFLSHSAEYARKISQGVQIPYDTYDVIEDKGVRAVYLSTPLREWLKLDDYQAYINYMRELWEIHNNKRMSDKALEILINKASIMYADGSVLFDVNQMLLDFFRTKANLPNKNWWEKAMDWFDQI